MFILRKGEEVGTQHDNISGILGYNFDISS